jgi:hypothetical protein
MTHSSSNLETTVTEPIQRLIEAATRLLEARDDQMVTAVEWQDLHDAVVACGGKVPTDTVA